MSYARTQPARAPDGKYYDVSASPRGDLLLWFPDSGPQTWFSANLGVLGIFTFLINRLFFRGRWQVVITEARQDRWSTPSSGIIHRETVPAREVEDTVDRLVSEIEHVGPPG